MSKNTWKTAITKVEPNKISIRGYPINELMGRVSFGQMVYLLFKRELPPQNEGRMIEAILTSSVDHGVTPPSVLSALTVASTGSPLNAAVAAGTLAISKFHGGAIEDCMLVLKEIQQSKLEDNLSIDEAVTKIILAYKEKKKKISGFGHRVHTDDPRTTKLFQLAEELGIVGEYITIARILEAKLHEITGRKLPINVDGAIGAVLCNMDFDPQLANAFFMIARLPGMVAHIVEEKTRQRPMRKIDPANHEYDGPSERPVPESL
jgi:citrate synthase